MYAHVWTHILYVCVGTVCGCILRNYCCLQPGVPTSLGLRGLTNAVARTELWFPPGQDTGTSPGCGTHSRATLAGPASEVPSETLKAEAALWVLGGRC